MKTWEELYQRTKESTDSQKGKSFKEWKKEGHARTFSELYGEQLDEGLFQNIGNIGKTIKLSLRLNKAGMSSLDFLKLMGGARGDRNWVPVAKDCVKKALYKEMDAIKSEGSFEDIDDDQIETLIEEIASKIVKAVIGTTETVNDSLLKEISSR